MDAGNFEAIIPIAGGIAAILFINGNFPKNPKNPEALAAFRKKWDIPVKVLAFLVILVGIANLFGIF